ncbi:MAG TPA: PaaI family thioesterase [Mycobacteriales bacterium]|nr:PaaI family thioesterase [Mycobacteriales bacterium]
MTMIPTAPPASRRQTPSAPDPARVVEPAAYKLARLAPLQDGREFLEAIKAGALPAPPIADLVGFDIRSIDLGTVTVELTVREQHYNPIGVVHGGIAATLLDTAMGCAVQTRLPRGVGYSTLDLQVRYLRSVTMQTGTVLATGTVVHFGRRTAVAEARLVQETTGALLATATSTLLVVRP